MPLPRALPAMVLLALTSCWSDGRRPPPDGRPPTDARLEQRGERPPLIPEAGLPDLPLGPCEKKCLDVAIDLCVTDPATGECVECLESSQCTGNIGALGSKCDLVYSLCICESDDDCKNNSRGNKCNISELTCTCETNSDCKPPLSLCSGQTLRTCRRPCLVDSDCKSAVAPRCHKPSGECVACLADADCAKSKTGKTCHPTGRCVPCKSDGDCGGPTPVCDAATGQCAACHDASQCAASAAGAFCAQGSCRCLGDVDCKAAAAWGGKCLQALVTKRCGCGGDGDCAGKTSGPICAIDYQKCSCTTDGQCTTVPYSKCGLHHAAADYLQCGQPCGSDGECQARPGAGLIRCDGGRCVACSSDADCAGGIQGALCLKAMGKCVECKGDGDCKGTTPLCDATGRCVECKGSADCAASGGGAICDHGSCGCAADGDCAASTIWGSKCVTVGPMKRCGCQTGLECSKAGTGPTCNALVARCICTSDADCAKAPYTACGLPLAGAAYLQCAKPCSADGDCTSRPGLPRCSAGHCVECKGDSDCGAGKPLCNTTVGSCVRCKTSPDCAAEPWARICDAIAGCVECLADPDCTAGSLGKSCAGGLCTCATAADCAGNLNGKRCDLALHACGCANDGDCPPPRHCTGTLGATGKVCK